MKPRPCLAASPGLETAAQIAEQRKRQALDHLMEALSEAEAATSEDDAFGRAMVELIDADKRILEAKRR